MLRAAWTPKSEHEPLNYCPVTDIVWGRTTIKPPSICTSLEEHDACSFITEGHKWLLFKRVVIKRSQLCEENVTCFNSFSYCLGLSYSLTSSLLVAERTENTMDKEAHILKGSMVTVKLRPFYGERGKNADFPMENL